MRFIRCLILVGVLLSAACGGGTHRSGTTAQSTVPTATCRHAQERTAESFRTLVDAPDRSDEDRQLDAGRKPADMLAFFGIKEGMKVAELGAGTGYTTEILARAVGPTGKVYAQNNRWILEKFAEQPWSQRLQKAVMANVVRVDREFDDPLPPEARDLDAVFIVLFYHDSFWFGVDRPRMNEAIFRALKPGGVYAIIDHSGREGTGITEVKTLHRVEESAVREDIEKAGFKLAAEAEFLRNPSDTRDWNAAPFAAGERRGTSDRFVLKFIKP